MLRGAPAGAGRVQGYPRRTELATFPVDAGDRSLKLGLTPYHDLAPWLNELQRRSDRVSVEVIGRSTQGRDLYLVTVTSPETPAQARRQERLRAKIQDDPAAAARDRALLEGYKAPVFVNANIHGNEWEGTDGARRVIERLATSDDPAVRGVVDTARVHVVVTMNPDGRVAGTRRNAADFDLNRDFITGSQPETRAVREAIIGAQPLVLVDEHGYTGTTLIEPGTPPHGQNYEYDLYLKHAYENALGMERAIQALGLPETTRADIPFRDFTPGEWDDWPPIFTPMYSVYHGAVGQTVEFPLRVNGAEYDTLPVTELRRRSEVNTRVAEATITAAVEYAVRNRRQLVADQVEVFRRGAAGEAQRTLADGAVPGFGPEDRYTTTFPRAYVVPAGDGQRSAAAAARLVDHLVANDVRVTRASAPFTAGGVRYGAGSYVVDMHQAKRGLANVVLEAGRDISEDVPVMYDISGWSHRLLWGASVDVVREGDLSVDGDPVAAAAPTGAVAARRGDDLLLRLDDPADVSAVNALLDAGVALRGREDGTAVAPAAARREVERVAERYGVRVEGVAPGTPGAALEDVTVAAAAGGDELTALAGMGFDVVPVSTAVLDAGFSWEGVDVLYVSTGLDRAALGAPARAALDAFVADGGVVTRGATGAAFNDSADLLDVTAVRGPGAANGVVAVENSGGPLTAGALPNSFVYSPLWFTDLGAGVVAEQRYASTDPLVAGHWRAGEDGAGGQQQAAGQASLVRGVDEDGTAVVSFGTEPLFRDHPKGLFAQVARAVHWTAVTAR
ncbi:peptidase M28 [Kineococcus sp. T90]|nr:peptidase M28 [Kineococcus indalonis]